MSTAEAPNRLPESSLRILRVYSYYRFVLSALLLAMFAGGISRDIFGSSDPRLFFHTAIAYCLLSAFSLIRVWWGSQTARTEQVFATIVIDLLFISLLTYSSGGTSSGLGYLFFITVITASLFIQGQIHYALAALASIFLLTSELLISPIDQRNVFSAGAIGALLFLVSGIFQNVSLRLQLSERAALEQAAHARYLEQLTHRIVARLYTGIVVVNKHNEVEIINQSAKLLLNCENDLTELPFSLDQLPDLQEHLKQWQEKPQNTAQIIQFHNNPQELRIGFVQQGEDTLIFIDDNRQIHNQAQQLKLASLGRLTASIAHEIRNPLGALSHANQLLQESPEIHEADKRLTEIIDNHCMRVNGIIESVLHMSRRRAAKTEAVELNQWCSEFCKRYSSENGAYIRTHSLANNLNSACDPHQMDQVLSNLVDNGVRYSEEFSSDAKVELILDREKDTQRPIIDIVDSGPGISEKELGKIFEPFYTTHHAGSGLGLYLVKELCEANQVSIFIKESRPGHNCFRLRFPDPEALLQ